MPDGRTTTRPRPTRRPEPPAQAVGGRQQVLDVDGTVEQPRRRPWPQPVHDRGDVREVVHAHGDLVGDMAPELGRELVQPGEQRRPGGLQLGGEVGDAQRRADAVLVPHEVGRDGVPQRLLVAVDEVVGGSHDPLEPGERLGVVDPVRAGQRAEQSTRTRSWSRRCRGRRPGAARHRAARRPRRRAACATCRPRPVPLQRSGRRPGRWRARGRRRPARRGRGQGRARPAPRGSGRRR